MDDVDVLRMDTEGYEYKILSGIPDLDAGDGVLINVEFHANRLGERAEELLDTFAALDAELLAATWKGHAIEITDWEEILEYRWLTLLVRIPGRGRSATAE